jgi:hypothetical protein
VSTAERRPAGEPGGATTDDRDDVDLIVARPPAVVTDWAAATRDRRVERDRRALDELVRRDTVRRAPIQVQPRRPRDLDAQRQGYRDGYARGWLDAIESMRSKAGTA